MATPVWQPGTIYPTGSIVQPTSPVTPPIPAITNPDFTGSATGWTLTGAIAYDPSVGFGGAGCVRLPGNQPDGVAQNDTEIQIFQGDTISVSCMVQQGASIAGATAGWVELKFYNASDVQVGSTVAGNIVNNGSGGAWGKSQTAVSTAPANTTYARVGIHLTSVADHSHPIWGDHAVIESVNLLSLAGLVYRAVQPGLGTSDSSEPVWPPTVGVQVTDGTVTWEGVLGTRITYIAKPILRSGATEPTWPTQVGENVADGTISWLSGTRQVEQAPNSKVVAITASKVYAADEDIIKYCATINPLDWTSTDDAGYLPSGLNQNGSNDTAVLNIYRASLVSFSSTTFQNWQVDPDPANMSLLDVMEGIGSTWQHAAQPVSKDLFYLGALGVRTVGISAGSTNLVNGDIGMPIDPLVRTAIKSAESNESDVIGLYYPSLGQYWLAFADFPPPDMFVSGLYTDWTTLTNYSGTVSFGNSVGDVSVEWTGGDELPVGATLTVNNTNKTVVLTLPITSAGELGDDFTFSFELVDSLGRDVSATRSVTIALPVFTLSGSLPDWDHATSYASSLSVSNNYGDFTIVSVGGDVLPAGWSIAVDNPNDQVDIGGPADVSYPIGPLDKVITIQDESGRQAVWVGSILVTQIVTLDLVALGASPPARILSTDGMTWSSLATLTNYFGGVSETVPVPGERIICCQGSFARYSDDTINWTIVGLSEAVGSSSPLISVGDSVIAGLSGPGVMRSLDRGLTWDKTVLTKVISALGAIPGLLVALSNITEPGYSTDDGVTFSAFGPRLDTQPEAFSPSGRGYGGAGVVAFGGQMWGGPLGLSAFIPCIAYTSDGINFSYSPVEIVNISTSGNISLLVYGEIAGNPRWIAVSTSGFIYTSTSIAGPWTKSVTVMPTPSCADFNNELFVIGTNDPGSAQIGTTTDGTTITLRTHSMTQGIVTMARLLP